MRFILMIGLYVGLSGVSAVVFADAVYLKSGDVVEGNILQTNDEWTMIKTGVKILKYPADQIEKMEKDDVEIVVAPQEEELTDEKRELIKGLLVANGIERLIQKNIDAVLVKAPADRQAELKEFFKQDILIDLLIPVYAETFSTQELEKMVNFFNSPTGKKFVEVSPAVLERTFKALVDYFKSNSAL